ncbi:N-formylglutamate amidohydrolase [candidate division KSB1 bacterium]
MEKTKEDCRLIVKIEEGHGPVVGTSIHSGHAVRDEIHGLFALDEPARLREEDPFTEIWTPVGNTRIIGLRSRFEVDLNRPRDKAVYITPEDAWGLHVWKKQPDIEIINRSLSFYDYFYKSVKELLERLIKLHGRIIVFDIHSYNHRRDGADTPAADSAENPEINLGTKTMDRSRWARIVDRFINDIREFDYKGRRLDIRENVKFGGGYFPKWIHTTFPDSVCALSVEVKKFYMDEWTGIPDGEQMESIKNALSFTVDGVLEELIKL